jgi:hypothetical protein
MRVAGGRTEFFGRGKIVVMEATNKRREEIIRDPRITVMQPPSAHR